MANEPRNYSINRLTGRYTKALTLADAVQSTGAQTAVPLAGAYTVFALQQHRATTSATLESTKASYRIRGSIDGSAYHTIGAATRAVSSTSPALSAVTSTAAISHIQVSVNLFTTSAGAASTAENRIPLTVKVLPLS